MTSSSTDSAPDCTDVPRNAPERVDGSPSSNLHVPVDSATAYLLKKAASGILPLAASVLWGMIQELEWDENVVGVIEASRALRRIDDCGEGCSPDADIQDDEVPPAASDMSDSSSCDQNEGTSEGGLMFQSAEFNQDETPERLDYVISQVDISRMARTASRQLDVKDVHQLPTVVYSEKSPSIYSSHHEEEGVDICSSHHDEEDEEDDASPSICSSHHDEEDVDEFLLRNAQIIEDYFDNTEENTAESERRKIDPVPVEFSWMVVPDDPRVDEMVRVPDSISICKSTDSSKMAGNRPDDETYEHCVICEEPFAEGERLRVLPCQHLFHDSCIDKWLLEESCCVVSGCPACKNKPTDAMSRQGAPPEPNQGNQGDSSRYGGSVSPWSLPRWGIINSKKPPSSS